MEITRRDLGKLAMASVPLSRAFAAKRIDSKFGGVQIGAITYSFNRIASPDPEAIIRAYVEIGLGEVGVPPTPEILKSQPKWVWFMTWSGDEERMADRFKAAYTNPYFVNRGDPIPGK